MAYDTTTKEDDIHIPVQVLDNFDFLMYFHKSLICSVTYVYKVPGEKVRSNLKVKLHKMYLRGQSVDRECKIHMTKWAHPL